MKACTRCGEVKSLDEFGPRKQSPDGLTPRCRACLAALARQWAARNPERVKVGAAASRERAYEQRAEYNRAYRRRADLEARRPRRREREALRRERIRAASLVPFTSAQLAQRLAVFGCCWMCGGSPDQVDHVKPIIHGGPHILANLRPICARCNQRKGTRWPVTVATHALARQ